MPPYISLAVLVIPAYLFVIGASVAVGVARRVSLVGRDLRAGATAVIHYTPYLALLVVAAYTPLAAGAFLWAAAALAVVAGVIFLLALGARGRAGPGLATAGVYRFSRNPIYVAATLFFISVTLAAFQASSRAGLLALVVTYTLIVANHVTIRREEAFLEEKFGDHYRAYCARVGRYLFF